MFNSESFELSINWTVYESILFHVLSNAVKFNKPGGNLIIKIDVEERPATLFSNSKWALLKTEIIDSGYGIDS